MTHHLDLSKRPRNPESRFTPMFRRVLCAASVFAFSHAAAAQNGPHDASATERKIARLEAEQRRLIDQLKRELAALPAPSGPQSGSERDRRAKLMLALAELEQRVDAGSPSRTRYVTATTAEPAIHAYYERFQRRVEQQGESDFPKNHGASLYGQVMVVLTVTSAGNIESIEIAKTTSDRLAKHAVKLLKQLEPFERFPPEVAKGVDRMVIVAPFNYRRE